MRLRYIMLTSSVIVFWCTTAAAQPPLGTDNSSPMLAWVASLVAAFAGSWVAVRLALGRFKQERRFDRRLDSYEQSAKALAAAKLRLEVARTFEEDPDEPPTKKRDMWLNVQTAYLELIEAETIAVLYAAPRVLLNLRAAREAFDEVSDATNGCDPDDIRNNPLVAYPLIETLDDRIEKHAALVRADLGFEKVTR